MNCIPVMWLSKICTFTFITKSIFWCQYFCTFTQTGQSTSTFTLYRTRVKVLSYSAALSRGQWRQRPVRSSSSSHDFRSLCDLSSSVFPLWLSWSIDYLIDWWIRTDDDDDDDVTHRSGRAGWPCSGCWWAPPDSPWFRSSSSFLPRRTSGAPWPLTGGR